MAAATQSAVGLLRYGEPGLHRRCRDVAVDEDVAPLARAMIAGMEAQSGVGLAAPQVGDLRRVIVVTDPLAARPRPRVMVNPVIEAELGPLEVMEEGCLSFPDLYLKLVRPRGVVVGYRGLDGRRETLRDEGFLARVVQHEVDHLDGILFIEHLPRWRRWLLGWRLLWLRRRVGEVAA